MADSDDARLVRVEVGVEQHREQLKMLFPLVTQYAVLEERLGKFREDLNGGLAGVREAIAACVDEISQVRRDSERRAEVERKRAEVEREEREKREKAERKDRWIRVTTLIALGMTALSTTAAVIALVVHP